MKTSNTYERLLNFTIFSNLSARAATNADGSGGWAASARWLGGKAGPRKWKDVLREPRNEGNSVDEAAVPSCRKSGQEGIGIGEVTSWVGNEAHGRG